MIYVVYGKEEYLVDQKVKELTKNPITYDLEFDNLKDILFDASMISLLDDKKYIVVNNPYFLSMTKEGEPNIDTSVLEDYLNNINPNTVIVFKYYREKLMETKKITKLLKNKGIFYEFNKVNNLDIIKDKFDGYKIDKESINILIDRVGDNTAVLINEIEKLKTYKYDTKEITKEDVLEVNKYEEIDFFKFIDHIINKEKDLALNEYFSLLNQKEEPIKILIVIASKIRLMYQVKVLSEKGFTVNDIANKLETKSYPVQLAGIAAKKYSKDKLLNTLINIGELDENIKTGKVVPVNALELFIINL